MRGFDCDDAKHGGKMHFSADDDTQLVDTVKQHRDEHHPEISDEQIQQLVSSSAYDE
jgi:predicted small metal-binding protein